MKSPIMLSLVAGMLTGMGNGSVFGATMMCFLGRGKFDDWGGWGALAYDPTTFTGFVDWSMIVFGIAFFFIVHVAVNRHLALETKSG